MSEQPNSFASKVTLLVSVCTLIGILLGWLTAGVRLVDNVDRLLTAYGELKIQADAIEARGINTANELTTTRTEQRNGFNAVQKKLTELDERAPKKRGRP